MSIIQTNAKLAEYTTLGVGGVAEQLIELDSAEQLLELSTLPQQLTVLGYGANVLISDAGISGSVILLRGDTAEVITCTDTTITVDAACNWDALVAYSIEQNLWGFELTSGIPGGVGAAVVGNIAAYGQAVADSLLHITVYDPQRNRSFQLTVADLELEYRYSNLQQPENRHLVVISATFELSHEPTMELTYQRALDTAAELDLDPRQLQHRRKIILETRRRAGSLLDGTSHTAGSFFRNPLVTREQADRIIEFDETGKTAEQISRMNRTHGGDDLRVSAAHVLLAAGFERGQSWGPVRLHPDHVLKIENTGGARAQEIYDVATEIIATAKAKLGVNLQPEVKFLGAFD